jgi:hypothetical protein
MYVPNYIPEPLEVPGNVTQDRYPARMAFVRRVVFLHVLSLLVLTGLTALPFPPVGWPTVVGALALGLVGLDLLRIQTRGKPFEAKASSFLLLPLLVVVAWAARETMAAGFPAWALATGPVAVALYTLVCGRDFSFVGCYLLSLVASTIGVAALSNAMGVEGIPAGTALLVNAAWLFYYVYDLASLMARRRRGEELAAVVDLYRDVFNIFGYIPRVISHWRKHRIWSEVRKR